MCYNICIQSEIHTPARPPQILSGYFFALKRKTEINETPTNANTEQPEQLPSMSSNLDANDTMHLVTFRAPRPMIEAMKRAAAKQYSSVSDVARQAVAREMHVRGLLTEDR